MYFTIDQLCPLAFLFRPMRRSPFALIVAIILLLYNATDKTKQLCDSPSKRCADLPPSLRKYCRLNKEADAL